MASDDARAYRAKLVSLGFQARPKPTKTTVVRAEDEHGRIAGKHIEHKDGHVDAVITPKVTRLTSRVQE